MVYAEQLPTFGSNHQLTFYLRRKTAMKRLVLLLLVACTSSKPTEPRQLMPPGEAFRRDEYLIKACKGPTLKRKTCEERIRIEKGWAP